MKILITGSAGFIGFHICKKLLENGYKVFGIDNLNSYYDINLKLDRNKILKKYKNYLFLKSDISKPERINNLVKKYKIKLILHLAAQAGVRYSIEKPEKYFESNIKGFFNILEISRKNKINHLLFASTSSVYGNKNKFPLKEGDRTDHPESFYAASKKSNEIMAYSYSSIYNLPCTGLRFFTVYGPYGRPDMAIFKFTENIFNGKKVELFNEGKHKRDFSYIDDIIDAIQLLVHKIPEKNIPFDIYNIGRGKSESLLSFFKEIEKNIGKTVKLKYLSMQKGDVKKTHSSITKISKKTGYNPKKNIQAGIRNFVDWYKKYYFN